MQGILIQGACAITTFTNQYKFHIFWYWHSEGVAFALGTDVILTCH